MFVPTESLALPSACHSLTNPEGNDAADRAGRMVLEWPVGARFPDDRVVLVAVELELVVADGIAALEDCTDVAEVATIDAVAGVDEREVAVVVAALPAALARAPARGSSA